MVDQNETPKQVIKNLISLPVYDQMAMKEKLIKALESYLKTCKTPDDLDCLNNGNDGKGLWFGDARILALIGAYGGRIYSNQ